MFLLKDKILYSINPTRFLAFLVLVIFIASSQRLNAQLCQLSIDSSLPSDTTDCGDCFTLTAIGEDDVPLLESNFNNNSLGPGWSSNVTVMYSNPCGAPPDGTPAAWFGLGTQPREMETVDYNVSCGGEICFEMKYATQGGSGNCEGPDLVGEGVYLQYSTNGGATWINIQYHPPNGGYDPQLTQWNEYCYNIPVAAQTNSTRFRWFQDVGSGAMFDHWGLDNIYVTGTNCGTFYYDWGADGSENVADTNVCLDGNEQTYNVIYTDGLSDTCSASITIYSDLQVELDADTLICGLTEIDLVPTTSGGSGNFDYEWSTGDVTPQLDDVDTTSLYWVEITDIDHPNCNNRDSAMIEIYPNPDIDFSVFPLCLGVPSEFEDATTLPDGYNIDSWNWNFDDNGATSNDQNPIHSFSDVGDYDVTLTVVTENGCDSDSTRMITVDPQPVADFNFEDVCHGETTMFTDESTGDYATTDWDFDDGSPINTESDPAHEYAEDGDYNVTLIITSASGVCGDTITQNVNVFDMPNVNFSVDDSVSCSPLCMTLNSNSSVNYPSLIDNYNWYLNNELVQSGDQSSYSECIKNKTGDTHIYDVELVATTNNGCESSLTYDEMLTVYHNPKAAFENTPKYADVYEPEIEFTNTSEYEDSVFWNFGEFETSTEDIVEVEFPVVAGDYLVELLALTEEGCRDSVDAFINMDDKLLFFVPNTFTPDGDEFNERFGPEFPDNFEPQDFKFFIYNRWGETVFESRNHKIGWDGTYGVSSGMKADAGTYVWKIEFKEERTDKRYEKSGHVTLMR